VSAQGLAALSNSGIRFADPGWGSALKLNARASPSHFFISVALERKRPKLLQ
jgi:hypothetical protein